MHKTASEAGDYARRLVQRLELLQSPLPTVFVIPPFIAIETVRKASAGKFLVGAQNMHWADWGPYTGEISAPMLRELGVDLVELGHAERREFYNETDVDVNRKIHTALRFGLRPLLCIGEEAKDRDFGVERETIARQLRIALHDVPSESVDQLMIAYEPWWAIGDGGTTAEPEYIRDILSALREILVDLFGSPRTNAIPVLYGGSVLPAEAPDLLYKS
jgi:triosephosphate isomerase